jgi:hypothetical protein
MGFTGIAVAQTQPSQTPGVDKRQQVQQQRIEKGVESGALTQNEAARLAKRQHKIEADKQKALADGTVTKRERARLHQEQDRASRQIYRQKHDRQRQPGTK